MALQSMHRHVEGQVVVCGVVWCGCLGVFMVWGVFVMRAAALSARELEGPSPVIWELCDWSRSWSQ